MDVQQQQEPAVADAGQDLSREELTSLLLANFGEEPAQPEHPPQQLNMDAWLRSEDFDASRVTVREMEGGLDGMGIVLENVFTRRECRAIIEETEKVGYGHLGEGKTGRAYRGNCRLQIDDVGGKLGHEIWRRIAPFVRATEDLPGEGRYEYLEMNSRYRFAKYFAGQGFAIHVDKPTIYEHEKCSILTVNIYLNDLLPEQGGLTRFFKKMTGGQPVASAGGLAGSIAIFKQSLVPYSPVHDGGQLISGLKYLMRTDVVYKPVE
jgi:prolyl 4-hydroxylase